jgi:uncharacterized circularly permuted ATP-grasp superfamily protein
MAFVAPVMRDDAWLARAVDRYHELCTDKRLAGPDVVAAFVKGQLDAGLTFGGVVQCRSLRPAFITRERVETLRSAVSSLWDAFKTLEERALRDESLAAEIGLSADERALAAIDPGYDDATIVSRLDTYFHDTPRVLEYNADSPAGMSYQAGQAALMRRLPVMTRFSSEFRVQDLRADIALRDTLLGVWREFAARKGIRTSTPVIAIVDLAGAASGAEFSLVARDLEHHGIPALIATPEDLTYRGGKLHARGRDIDLVYKRLLVADFLAHYDTNHPLVQAYADGAVCIASSFRCTIAHKKKALSALLDPRHSGWFTAEEGSTIPALVARTAPLSSISPRELESEQQSWALKPNDAHGGEGVALGWETDAAQWRALLEAAQQADYVVQERIEPTFGTYPIFDALRPVDGASQRTLIEDCNAYVFRGSLGGILTRLSEAAVINVSRGGQAIPTFVVEPL